MIGEDRRTRNLRGVYLITAPQRPMGRLVQTVAAALEGGVSLVQYRDKGTYSERERVEAGRGIRRLCRRHDVPFLVNDDPELALRLGTDGVHVGRDDPSPRTARSRLGPEAIIGVTVYGTPDEEEAAESAGADYLAIGTFFPSPTKPEKVPLPLTVLDEVVARSHLPVFAIGGITAERARVLAEHGVAGVAVVSAIMDAEHPRVAAEEIRRAFEGTK